MADDHNKHNESDDEITPKSQFFIGVLIVKLIVIFFDIITFPIYYLIQQPWIAIKKQREVVAALENPNDPYSSYVRVVDNFRNHYILKAQTIPESQQLVLKLNPKDMPILATRKLINVVKQTSRSGKQFLKYHLGEYEWMTLEQVDKQISNLAYGFVAEGVQFQQKVLIYSETRLEWFLCAQALFRIGAVVTTLYTTLGKKSVLYGIQETEVEHIITTSDMLPTLLELIDQMPLVKNIYVIEIHRGLLKSEPITENDFNKKLEGQNRLIKLITYNHLAKIGYLRENELHYTRPKPSDLAVILYTSGSTGNPKGVLVTQENLIAAMHAAYAILNQEIIDEYDSHIYYAILPLSHIFELMVELALFSVGIKIGYGSPHTMLDSSTAILKGQKGDLKILSPTIMAAVPLIMDRIRKAITDRFEKKKSVFMKQLVKFFLAYKNYWLERGFDTPMVNELICKRLNGNLGGKVKYMICGGAPLSPDTQRMMKAFLNVQILVGYGSSETCGAASLMSLHDLSIGNVGTPLKGVKIRLIDWTEGGYSVHDKPYPRGELVIGGKSISKGYFKLPEKTAESFEDKDGIWWFKMGDIGEINKIGAIKIIDRKKDLVKLQFGEYISLGKVETELKVFSYVENICIYGDSMHTYVIALISPSRANLARLAQEMNKSNLSFEEQCEDPEILNRILTELKQFCAEVGLHKMETPQKIKLCSKEWSMDSGFLTASLKIKRREIQKFYEETINEMYKN
ncbi:long-chain-fatty-acid-coa ligase-like protein 2 [Dermatophagoides farinae]|nr:long-chain-fatty-acid-coa ligase-like protein 2 [Dermatophagoides farinae]